MKRLQRLLLGIALVCACASCQETGTISPDRPAPRLISIVPQTVWNGCTAIISGTGFSENAEENIVTVDGIVVPAKVATTNRLTIVMPEHEIGKVKIAVTVGNKAANVELDAIGNAQNVVGMLATRNEKQADLSNIGESSNSCITKVSLNVSNWKKNYTDVRIIDQSASGLFEKVSENLLDLL